MDYVNIEDDLTAIRNYILKSGFSDCVVEILDAEADKLKDNTVIIDVDIAAINDYVDGDSDTAIDVYAYHSSRIEATRLRQRLMELLDDAVINCMRLTIIDDENPYDGQIKTTSRSFYGVTFKLQIMK